MSRKKLNKACAICHPKNRYCEALASASRINLYWWNSNSTLIFKLWSLISSALNLTPFTFHLKAFYFALVFSLFALSAQAQTYPVQVTPVLLPPYSLNTSDYYNGTTEKLAVVLTNTDLQKPSLGVRLRMYIEGQNAKLQSREGVYYPTITLDAGIPQRISLGDLAPYFNADNLAFSGITRSMYLQNGKLPEGFYQFCFEAIEVNTGKVVSRKSCSMAWISLLDPPLLNLPAKGESVASRAVQNIIFQWTPRNMGSPNAAFNTEYEFTLKELWDTGIAPEAAFQSSQPLYQATVRQTTLLMGPAEPQLIPGKRYAWRVRAVSTSPTGEQADSYRNNGFSEIYWFTYQSDCRPPLAISSSVTGGRATISWQADASGAGTPAGGYTLQYRERSLGSSKWYSINTLENRAMLYDLKPGTIYEYRVGSSCVAGNMGMGTDQATYSDLLTLEISGNPNDTATVNCGMISPEIAIANRTPIQALNQGELIMAGGFPVRLTQVSGGGSFSGTGYVTIPMLGQVNVKVRFSGIQVNTERQLFAGVIETTYDPSGKQIANLDKIIEGGDGTGIVVTGKDYADYQVDFPIKGEDNIKPVFKDKEGNEIPDESATPAASATITVNDGSGKTKTIEADKIPATVKDSEGTVYKVEQGTDGRPKVTKVGQSVPMQMTLAELNRLDTDRGAVFFGAHPKQTYAFDTYRAEYAKSKVFGVDVYQKLNDNYFVNAKAILPGKTDLVKATIALKDNSLKADSVQFVTGKGVKLNKNKLEGNEYEITVVGGPANDAQELFALYPQGNGKYLSLGKLLIASYQPKTVKVQLVPVNGNTLDKNAVAAQLNKTYNPIGVSLEVDQAGNFVNTDWDLNKDGKLAVSGSGFLATQTAEMKALNSAYKAANPNLPKDVAVLFMLNSSDSTANLAGDMPRGKQFGYLFSNADGNTAAHEIGHGLFKLEHTFGKYGFTKDDLQGNLMNYPAGEGLTKFQWDAIHAPGIVIGVFESDDDGQSDNVAVEKLITWLKTNKDKEAEFKKYDYFESRAWVDVAQTAVDINGKPFTVYVELGENGIVDFRPNSEGLFKNYGIAIHYEGKYASKYHTGFSLKVRYADRADAAIVFWTYSFTDYEKLLNKIGIALNEPAQDNIYNQYTKELTKADKDPDKLDVLFENMLPFVLARLTKEQRWDYLKILCKGTLTGRQFGTSEEEAVVNILKTFSGELKWLYEKLYTNKETVENIYKEIQGDNLLVALEVFRQAADASGKNVDGASKYIYIGSAGEAYKDNSFLYGYPYLLTSESGWNADHDIKLDCVIARPNIIPTNWGSVEVRKQINQIPYINPLELIKVYMDEPSNEELLPAIYALHLGAIKNRTELMGAIGKAANILATATSGKILFSRGSSGVIRVLAALQLAKTGLDIAMADPAVQKELDNSEEGKWLKQKWPTISLATDITLLGSDILAGLAKNGTKAASQIRKIKNGEFNEAADNLDNLAIEAKNVNAAGNYTEGLVNGVRRYNVGGEIANGIKTITREISYNGNKITLKWTIDANGIIGFGNRSDLAKLLGTIEDEAHHILTWTKSGEHSVVQSAAKDGFHLNSFENGIGLSKYKKALNEGLHGNHPAYDDYVVHRLSEYKQSVPYFTPNSSNEFIQKVLIPDMHELIEQASKSNLNLNEYFKQVVNPTIPNMLK